jgi:uncharacterized membrane-anchored protein
MSASSSLTQPRVVGAPQLLNKVPEVTLYFWLIKCLCTTVGETFSDNLTAKWAGRDPSLSTVNTASVQVMLVTFGVLVVAMAVQFTRNRYVAPVYWLNVVLISVFGTQITDQFEGNGVVPNHMVAITVVSLSLLVVVFAVWWYVERTLSMHSIRTHRREAFYWLAILTTFASGTAVGDLVAEKVNLGYFSTLLVFLGVIAVIAVIWKYVPKANGVLMFWLAYIMTRPLGASTGDLLSQRGNQGLDLGTNATSYVFLGLIVLFVAFLAIRKPDITPVELSEHDEVYRPRAVHAGVGNLQRPQPAE